MELASQTELMIDVTQSFYALHAIATVRSSRRADRQFSVFRFGRYDAARLAECLREIGWEEIGVQLYGGESSLRLYRKLNEGRRAPGDATTRAGVRE